MTSVASLLVQIGQFWLGQTVTGITKKMVDPAIEEIDRVPVDTMIVNFDRLKFENLAMPMNDRLKCT